MALRALVALNPGDLMLLQFPTSAPSLVKAVVRNRTGESLGLEFLTQLPPESEAMVRAGFLPSSVVGISPELRTDVRSSCNPQTLYAAGCVESREDAKERCKGRSKPSTWQLRCSVIMKNKNKSPDFHRRVPRTWTRGHGRYGLNKRAGSACRPIFSSASLSDSTRTGSPGPISGLHGKDYQVASSVVLRSHTTGPTCVVRLTVSCPIRHAQFLPGKLDPSQIVSPSQAKTCSRNSPSLKSITDDSISVDVRPTGYSGRSTGKGSHYFLLSRRAFFAVPA